MFHIWVWPVAPPPPQSTVRKVSDHWANDLDEIIVRRPHRRKSLGSRHLGPYIGVAIEYVVKGSDIRATAALRDVWTTKMVHDDDRRNRFEKRDHFLQDISFGIDDAVPSEGLGYF